MRILIEHQCWILELMRGYGRELRAWDEEEGKYRDETSYFSVRVTRRSDFEVGFVGNG